MFILKNKNDFNLLKRQKDIMTPLFHDDQEYNPGVYTLETSRSCANILATWITLRSFGQEGYQVMLGHALKMRELFVGAQKRFNEVGIVIEHPSLAAVDVYIRCIKTGKDVIEEHTKELDDDKIVAKNSKYTDEFFEYFNNEFQDSSSKVAISRSSASFYNNNGTKIVALRLYLLSLNNTEETIEHIISFLIKAKRRFDKIP
jgi:glutamate/tyrosine decarboxylase-like PLP-dependent enzyme